MNRKDRFPFWQKWLTYANLMAILMGFLVAFAGNSLVFDYHNSFTREVFFHNDQLPPETQNLKDWLFGIIGGTIVGFHTLMIMISENSFKKKEKWAYRAMWYGLLSWFIIDSSLSIYHGALYNVLLINIVALVSIGLPLIMTRKEF